LTTLDILNPLRTPEEEGELFNRDGAADICAYAPPALDGYPEVQQRNPEGFRPGKFENRETRCRREFERWLGDPVLLVAPADKEVFCLFHEFPAGALRIVLFVMGSGHVSRLSSMPWSARIFRLLVEGCQY
jgi:hypothetical protein